MILMELRLYKYKLKWSTAERNNSFEDANEGRNRDACVALDLPYRICWRSRRLFDAWRSDVIFWQSAGNWDRYMEILMEPLNQSNNKLLNRLATSWSCGDAQPYMPMRMLVLMRCERQCEKCCDLTMVADTAEYALTEKCRLKKMETNKPKSKKRKW